MDGAAVGRAAQVAVATFGSGMLPQLAQRNGLQLVTDQFISEAIIPDTASFAPAAAIGEPALPLRFTWRKRNFAVREVISAWKEHEPDRTHGSGELYLRKHWFEVQVDDGSVMKIYFQRQPMSGRARARWWLYSVAAPPTNA